MSYNKVLAIYGNLLTGKFPLKIICWIDRAIDRRYMILLFSVAC